LSSCPNRVFGNHNAIIKRLDGKTLIEGETREETTAAFLKNALRDPLQALLMAVHTENLIRRLNRYT
jgi:hypothetical protein